MAIKLKAKETLQRIGDYKNLYRFVLSTEPLTCGRRYFRSEMKRKTSFSFAFPSLNRTFGLRPKVGGTSEIKEKRGFSLYFTRFALPLQQN